VVDESLYRDLLYILKRAMKGSVLEFRARGREHITHPYELFLKGENITISHPEVIVNYGNGKYEEMRENGPTHHTFSLRTSLIEWIGERSFRDGHVLVTSEGNAVHIYLDERAEMV
jgi:hypothetical protein